MYHWKALFFVLNSPILYELIPILYLFHAIDSLFFCTGYNTWKYMSLDFILLNGLTLLLLCTVFVVKWKTFFGVQTLPIFSVNLFISLFSSCFQLCGIVFYLITLLPILTGHPFCTVKVTVQNRWLFMGGLGIWMPGNVKWKVTTHFISMLLLLLLQVAGCHGTQMLFKVSGFWNTCQLAKFWKWLIMWWQGILYPLHTHRNVCSV